MMNIENRFAKIISYVFNPLLMPSLGIVIIFNSSSYLSDLPFDAKRMILLVVFTGTFIIPVCFLPFYYYFKVINEINIDIPSQRIIPFAITSFIYWLTFYVTRKIPVPFLNQFILAATLAIVLNTIILFWWKISSHLIGIGGLTGLVLSMIVRFDSDVTAYLIVLLLVSGLLGFSRLKLNSHSPSQVYAGYLVGLLVVFCLIVFIN
jgi:membrane-associated phospholipid phosphatase